MQKNQIDQEILEISGILEEILPQVLTDSGELGAANINSLLGGKIQEFANIRDRRISTPDAYVSAWSEGYLRAINESPNRYVRLRRFLTCSKLASKYTNLFLRRAFLRKYYELSRARPIAETAYFWIGGSSDEFGLFVSPKFEDGKWISDKSEVRKFPQKYWSLGHVLHTGLVIKDEQRMRKFSSIKDVMDFTFDMVRRSRSQYQLSLFKMYEKYVLDSQNQNEIPYLFPELRFLGSEAKHKYRVDFSIIQEGVSRSRVGIELSPWSSHGRLSGIKSMTSKEVNQMALGSFEKEMQKVRDFYFEKGMTVLIFTDSQLKDMQAVFKRVTEILEQKPNEAEVKFDVMAQVFGKSVVDEIDGMGL